MKYDQLLALVGTEPVFTTGLLLAGPVVPADVRRQLARWRAAGRVIQLRRGVYTIGATYAKVRAHPFVLANAIAHGSYISLQSALAYHGLIPEAVPVVTSVGPGRPGRYDTPCGIFLVRHLVRDLCFGFQPLELERGQQALVASPEKALLDLVHLTPRADQPAYLRELRLDLERLDLAHLGALAQRSGRPKLMRAATQLQRLCAGQPEVSR